MMGLLRFLWTIILSFRSRIIGRLCTRRSPIIGTPVNKTKLACQYFRPRIVTTRRKNSQWVKNTNKDIVRNVTTQNITVSNKLA